jgi:hypothetical protein
MRTTDALRMLQEDAAIALLRRPSLGWTVKRTGLDERHFPLHLRPAFHIEMTKSQDGAYIAQVRTRHRSILARNCAESGAKRSRSHRRTT